MGERPFFILLGCEPITAHGLERLFEAEAQVVTLDPALGAAEVAADIMDRPMALVVVSGAAHGLRRWFNVLAELRWRRPEVRVLALLREDSPTDIRLAHRLDVHAALPLSQSLAELRHAVGRLLQGDVLPLPAEPPQDARPSTGPLPGLPPRLPSSISWADIERVLSSREREVFDLVGQGMAPRDIAAHLDLSVRTINAHRENLKRKLGCSTTSEVDRLAVRLTNSPERSGPLPRVDTEVDAPEFIET